MSSTEITRSGTSATGESGGDRNGAPGVSAPKLLKAKRPAADCFVPPPGERAVSPFNAPRREPTLASTGTVRGGGDASAGGSG